MNRVFSRLGLAAAIVAGAGTYAFAQTATTGAVSGTITDKAGAPVAGAAVRVTSAQTSRTYLTGADGTFRMGLLNPGSWTIEVTKSGFQKFSQTITVLVNQTQPVNVKMAAEAATVVEVLGTQTTIDNTTTQTGMVTSMDTLSAIPVGRDISSVTMLAPGVASGGFAGHNDPTIGGGSAAENSYVVDGLSTTNTSRGFQGASLVTDFIDQVEVQTGGFKPEYSALGGVINAITKSGTNEFKGSSWLTWDAIGIQALPKSSPYFRPTDQTANSRYDIGAQVGGPIIKDKLFYFVGVDGNITESPNALPNNNGLINSKEKVTTYQWLGKLNWYLTQDQQITFSANVNSLKDDYPLLYPTTGNANLGYNDKNTTQNFVLNYDWTISPSLFFSVKAGTTQYKDEYAPTDTTDIAVTDNNFYVTGPGNTNPASPYYNPALGPATYGAGSGLAFRSGGAGYTPTLDKTVTTQFRADLSWFVGTHNMKFGVSQLTSKYTEVASTSGGERVTLRRSAAGAFLGVDRQFLHTNATVKAIFTGFYAQDTWDVGSGLKLMYGARYEIQDQRDLNNQTFLKFSNFNDQLQPRLGFTWDVNGDGRSKVSGSYARYFESIPQRMAIRVYANETYLRYRYSASNSTYNTTTGAYAYNTAGTGPSSITDFATPFSFDPIAEGVKLPQRNEYTLGYDHTFTSGWTAGIHGKYRELKNPMEDMVFTDTAGNPYDEGPAIVFDGAGVPQFGAGAAVIGNPGGFQQWRPNPKSMTLYWLAMGNANPNGAGPGYSYNSYGINILQYYNPSTGLFTVPDTRFPKAGNKYSSVDITLDKKTDRDVVSFSYTWSRLEGNYEGVVSSSNGQADGNITASFDYYPYVGYGLLPNDRTHIFKFYASHRFDIAGSDLNVGVNWVYQSGTPISYFDDGSSSNPPIPDLGGYGNATPQNGQLGQYGRTPATNNVDAHADFVYKFGGKFRLIPSIDMFNVFNTRYATGVFQQAMDQSATPDVRYGQATDWQLGRRYRFGIKLQF
ncbi:membrane protein [Geothrix rubra]|uniref:Membrane protein n=1 Tax=Geothrix rubra TaxID=2927977 RepID=A0ABQ5Q4L7_9BACT|nr:TonB-dependent receptor [Geothrix rubra]GLH69697.1 membrane protein [Geothrix rubra]